MYTDNEGEDRTPVSACRTSLSSPQLLAATQGPLISSSVSCSTPL